MSTVQQRPKVGLSSAAGALPAPNGVKLFALATGFIMAALDTTIINIAGPTIQRSLGADASELTWIVDGYVLTFAALLLLAGGLANRFGAKPIYQVGMGLFMVASAACAVSPNGTALIAARLVQGAGAALFMPSSLALLVHAFPAKEERARMLGWWSAFVSSASGLGPTLGGVMVSAFGWRSIFLVNLPVAAVGMLLTHRYVPPFTAPGGRRLAVPGHVIGILALGGLSFGLIEGPRLGWGAAEVLVAFAVAAVAAAAFGLREHVTAARVLPKGLFGRRKFAGANLVGFCFNFAMFGGLFLLGLFLQHARGDSPLEAGLHMLPMTFVLPLSNLLYARIGGRLSNGVLLLAALGWAAVITLLLSMVSPATPYWLIAAGMAVVHVGAGIVSPAMTAVLVAAAGDEHANIAGSVLNANRQIGSLMGIAAVAIAVASTTDYYAGTRLSFLLIGVAYAAGVLATIVLILCSDRVRVSTGLRA